MGSFLDTLRTTVGEYALGLLALLLALLGVTAALAWRGWRGSRRLARARSQLSELRQRDGLTDLVTRETLEEELAATIAGAERKGGAVCVAYLGLDGFRAINDAMACASATACCARSRSGCGRRSAAGRTPRAWVATSS